MHNLIRRVEEAEYGNIHIGEKDSVCIDITVYGALTALEDMPSQNNFKVVDFSFIVSGHPYNEKYLRRAMEKHLVDIKLLLHPEICFDCDCPWEAGEVKVYYGAARIEACRLVQEKQRMKVWGSFVNPCQHR